jgi:hypothetical protein
MQPKVGSPAAQIGDETGEGSHIKLGPKDKGEFLRITLICDEFVG